MNIDTRPARWFRVEVDLMLHWSSRICLHSSICSSDDRHCLSNMPSKVEEPRALTRVSANLLCFVPASSASACHLATDEFQASWSWAFTADALSTGNGSFFLRGAHLIAGFLNGWAVLMTLKSLRRELSRPKLPEGNCLASGGAVNFCLFTTAWR